MFDDPTADEANRVYSSDIRVRMKGDERELLRQAALKDGRTISGFVRYHIIRKALEILDADVIDSTENIAPRLAPGVRSSQPVHPAAGWVPSREMKSYTEDETDTE